MEFRLRHDARSEGSTAFAVEPNDWTVTAGADVYFIPGLDRLLCNAERDWLTSLLLTAADFGKFEPDDGTAWPVTWIMLSFCQVLSWPIEK